MIFQSFRNQVHITLRTLGWEVRRTSTLERARNEERIKSEHRKWELVKPYLPKTVLDIGANTGQFAELIRQVLPNTRIISFEPIRECFESLASNPKISAPFQAINSALGNENGAAVIHRDRFSPSSSLLKMEQLHIHELPFTGDSAPETIRIQRLDDLSAELAIELPLFVKIDVQGYEDRVILGGRRVLEHAVAVVMEVSSYSLYQNAPTFDRLYALMKELGFEYKGNVDQMLSRRDGRILQFDALFENVRAISRMHTEPV